MLAADPNYAVVVLLAACCVWLAGCQHLGEGGARGPPVFDQVNLPFVPEEYNRHPHLVDFTNDTDEVDGVSQEVLRALNQYVANASQTFANLTYRYAGRDVVDDNTTVYLVEVGATVCYSQPVDAAVSQQQQQDSCLPQNCTIELMSGLSTSGDLTVTSHSCRPVGNLCYVCGGAGEEPCPQKGNPRTALCPEQSWDEPSSVSCFRQFTEVAGLKAYEAMGCGELFSAEDDDQDDPLSACSSDEAGYRHVCSCRQPLCNGIPDEGGNEEELDPVMRSIRQLKAHVEEVLERKRCGSGMPGQNPNGEL